MFSRNDSLRRILGGNKNHTIASTFEKAKSLKFELLFGEAQARTARSDNSEGIRNAVDYHFSPGQVFGYGQRSLGEDFGKFHYAFVLRACGPGEIGSLVPGVTPGAQILVKVAGETMCARLMMLLKKLEKHGIDLSRIGDERFRRLNYLLEAKINMDYFAGDLIYEATVG